ncbi:Glycoside hydrolase family 15 protein [Hyphomicrobium sp. 1Nfss2.1]|uniref:glycoside hydrolase family 15 protein n=1 Tax=Hyphomicrobium sp. 1Nfss2.1 TaxID=3413936 RepID=UPI003C7ECACF
MPGRNASNPLANLDLAPIGNGRTSALVDTNGRIVWWCFPRFDSDPVFSRLLAGDDEKGFCDVVMQGQTASRAAYVRNTAIVETILEDASGNVLRITDFAPRFMLYERAFHPAQIVRRIEPLRGLPRVTIRLRPTFNYGQPAEAPAIGSNHMRFGGGADVLRVTTDAPLSYIAHETPFALTNPVTLVLGADEPLQASVDSISREFLERTRSYWVNWVRGLGIPLDWQSAIIRAAITLKLCQFEETGAIIAATTTSIPEAPGTQRNWDYRFCWLRDAFFVVSALNRLGATQTMENYLNYITTIAVETETPLQPVYGIIPNLPLTERIAENLAGFRGMGPVRIGNQASEQTQHDAYGSIILGASHMFIDERLPGMGDAALFRRLEPLGHLARKRYLEPDAGPWEYRGRARIHTYSAMMCWVACDRLARLAGLLSLNDQAGYWRVEADKIRDEILSRAWSKKWGALAGAFEHDDLDASVLLAAEFGLLRADDERYRSTVEVIGRELNRNGFMMRYVADDDFGAPETAFLACQFWYADALALIGETQKARDIFTDILSRTNSFGVLGEDIDPASGQLWGNIPQTYCMAGIINTAMKLSRSWEDAWAAS